MLKLLAASGGGSLKKNVGCGEFGLAAREFGGFRVEVSQNLESLHA